MILITGATGNIGRHLTEELAGRGERVRALVRDPARLAGPLDVVAGDLDRPETLRPAMAGVSRVFLLAPGPDAAAQDAAVIAAAVAAGVEHVVMVSSLGAELGGIAGGRLHMAGEALLRESGLRWTLLRPSEFMTNTLWWRDSIASAGAIFVPTGGGRVGFVDPADIAAVAARVLTGDGHHERTYRLTGPAALTTAEIAGHLSAVLDRDVRHVDIGDDDFRNSLARAGFPAPLIEMQSEYNAAIRAGTVDVVTDDVPRLLGRPARDYRTWATANAAAFGALTANPS
jgi:uncharacterized protein YbjT (DUF2867 family)